MFSLSTEGGLQNSLESEESLPFLNRSECPTRGMCEHNPSTAYVPLSYTCPRHPEHYLQLLDTADKPR